MHVKCNQTGKIFKAKIESLSKEDEGTISAADLVQVSQPIMEYGKRYYPVSVVKVESLRNGKCMFLMQHINVRYFVLLERVHEE